MTRPATRRTAGHQLKLPPEAVTEMRSLLPAVAEATVTAILEEVPSYEGALTGSMGENIRNAVQLALGGFLSLASGVPAETLVDFAELVFAYIDELSAASVAGHTDELATTGRVRQRLLERIARHLLQGDSPETVVGAAERAGWEPPTTLTAVVVPEAQVRPVLAAVASQTLVAAELPDLEDHALLLVPDAHGRRRASLLRAIVGRG